MFERTAEGSDEFAAKLVIPETEKVVVYALWGENNNFNGLLEYLVER
jgi:hypothetical protein